MNIIVIYSLSGQVSGLDKHQLSSDRPLKYAHIDIAASAGKRSLVAWGTKINILYSVADPGTDFFHLGSWIPDPHQRISVF